MDFWIKLFERSGIKKMKCIIRYNFNRIIPLMPLIDRIPVVSKFLKPRKLTTFGNWCMKVKDFPRNRSSKKTGYLLPVKQSETISRQRPISLDEDMDMHAFERGVIHYQHGYAYKIPDLFLACIPKARIIGSYFIVISPDNRIFSDSVIGISHLKEAEEMEGHLLRGIKRCGGVYGLLGMHWWQGYYHWIFDVLPRLWVLEQFEVSNSLPLIMPEVMTANQYEALALLGIGSERIVPFDGTHWEVDWLYFPSPLSGYGGSGNPSPTAVSWLRKQFLTRLESDGGKSKRRIYVSRRDASRRIVANEDQIIKFAEENDFEVVCPGEMSFQEQVQLFAQAQVVMGPHGAGLANMVFAPRQSVLIEFFPNNYVNGCYWALANLCDQIYGFLTGPPRGEVFEISITKLEGLLEKVLINSPRPASI